MKVLLVAVSAPAKMTGIHRHAVNLARCLLARSITVTMVVAPWQLESMEASELLEYSHFKLRVAHLKQGTIARNMWHCISLPRFVAESKADIVHLSYPVPFLKWFIRRPIVVTLHDLYPIEIRENFGSLKSIFNRIILRLCLRDVDAITTVSDQTLRLLRRYIPGTQHKAVRIYNCVAKPTDVAGRSPLPQWRGYPFLLCVAQHRRNKNIPLLIHAFHRLLTSGFLASGTRLVVVGISGPETEEIRRTVRELGLVESVVFLSGLSEEELHWCYRNAKVLVAPSLTEGFGFPVAEALQCGCKFVCSDIPTFREIDPGYGHYFSLDGDSETNLVAAITRASSTPPQAPLTLTQFSPETIGEQISALYLDLKLHHQGASLRRRREGDAYEHKL